MSAKIREHAGRAGSLLAALTIAALTLYMGCCAALASLASAAQAQTGCGALRSGCAARISDVEGEEAAEESEGEGESAGEEATASEEAEAEEAAAGTPTAGAQRQGAATVSDLRLDSRAPTALRHRHLSASTLGFSFTLSAAAKVRVTLAERTPAHARERWLTLPDSLTLTASAGRVSRALTGHNRLSAGHYRLTVVPAGGRPRSIYLSAGGR